MTSAYVQLYISLNNLLKEELAQAKLNLNPNKTEMILEANSRENFTAHFGMEIIFWHGNNFPL